MATERGDIWLAVAGLVLKDGKVLAVKKSYSATKGLWTLPGGFVNADETVDQAAAREVLEETGVEAVAEAIVAVRSGVLRRGKSDTLLVFRLRPTGGTELRCERELEAMEWKTPLELIDDPTTTEFLAALMQEAVQNPGLLQREFSFTRDYGYSSFHVFI
jgi:ADP-ribose pyrophosphatase YjhB (NUDIX family)